MEIELSGHYGYRRIVKTMAPMVLMVIVTSIYSIVDGLFISNYAGSIPFAAMNIIWPVLAIVSALGLMLGTGGSALVSKTFGEGDPEKANRIFSMLVWTTIAVGALLALVLYVSMPWLARILKADEEMLPYAVQYGRILAIAMPAFMLQMEFQPFFMTAEKPQFGTVMSIVSGVINILLDALLVAGLGWGLAGAAVATAAAQFVGGFYPVWFFHSKRNTTQLHLSDFHFDAQSMWKSCTNGLSEFVGNIAFNVIGICYNLQLMKYIGADGVSAYGILLYIGFIFAAVFIGYNMGITQVIAFNFGAGNTRELTSLLKKSLVLIAIAGITLAGISEMFAGVVGKAFFCYDDSLCRLAEHAIRIYMLSFLFCGFNMFASAWFTALNNGLISAIASFVRTFVLEMAAVFILPSLFGVDGIWMSVNVAEVLELAIVAALILGFRRRYRY